MGWSVGIGKRGISQTHPVRYRRLHGRREWRRRHPGDRQRRARDQTHCSRSHLHGRGGERGEGTAELVGGMGKEADPPGAAGVVLAEAGPVLHWVEPALEDAVGVLAEVTPPARPLL